MANQDLTAELALDLSVAAAHVLGEAGAFGHRQPTALVARDPQPPANSSRPLSALG